MSDPKREPRVGVFGRRASDSHRGGATRREAIAVGAFGAITLITASAIVTPAWAAKYPSWDDVQAAKGNEAAKNKQIANIKSLIAGLEQEVARTQAEAEKRGQEFFDAQQAFYSAQERSKDLQSQADAKKKESDAAIMKAGQLAAQLYRSGGDNASLSLIFDATASGPDALLAALGSMSKLVEHNQSIYEDAVTAKNTAQSLSDQAVVARDERDKLKKAAEAAMIAAQAAADAAEAALAAQQEKQLELEAQLKALQDTTAKTVAAYRKGEEERKRREEAARKAAEAARKAEEEAARKRAQSGGGGGKSGGGGSKGGGGKGGGSGWAKPAYGYISSRFGRRKSPGNGGSTYHEGIDIAAGYGTGIYAAKSGTVEYAGWYGGYGNYIRINHGGGVRTAYGHIRHGGIAVRVGQRVYSGQRIASVGSTGHSTGAHLHFETQNPNPVNPISFMGARGVYW